MLFISVFVLSWIFLLFVSNKKKLALTYPTALIAVIMSLSSDVLLRFIPLWEYHDLDTSMSESIYTFLDDFGLYPAIAIFYLQFAPNRFAAAFRYTFLWTLAGITVEGLMVYLGYMTYSKNWSLMWSYICDWGIFFLLWLHNRLFIFYSRRPTVRIDDSGVAAVTINQQTAPMTHSSLLANFVSRPGREMFLGNHNDQVEFIFWTLGAGETVPCHSHEGYEIHCIIEGELAARRSGGEEMVAEGAMISFSSRVPHSFTNLGKETARIMSIEISEQSLSDQLKDASDAKKIGPAYAQ